MSEGIQYGRYQLIKRLAAGGMAQVWLARQSGMEGFEKLLVIKQVLPHLAGTDEFITMFLDEARLAARLNHPNVVQVFDLGREVDEQGEETLYIAMEYIHGEDLRRIDRESRRVRNPIPIPLVCRIIADAAAGLHYAHALSTPDGRPLGIVHRDVSPQNVLVTFDGGVKVVDFGIAKAADRASKTRSGVLKGKYAYMSPEQASGKEIDARTDIFALGIMFQELLTGQRLFKRKSEILTLHAVVRCEVDKPSHANPIVPKDLDPIVMAALAKDPAHRFQTAEEFQLAIEDFLMRLGQPSSMAHLGVYMREVFEERLSIESQEGGPIAYLSRRNTTSSRSVGLAGRTPSSRVIEGDSRVSKIGIEPRTESLEGPSPELAAPAVERETSGGASASVFAADMRRRRSTLLAVGGAIAGALVVAGALYLFGGEGSDDAGTHLSAVTPTPKDAPDVKPPPRDPPVAPTEPPPVDPVGSDPVPGDPVPPPVEPPTADPTPPEEDPDPPSTRPKARPRQGTLKLAVSPAGATVQVQRSGKWQKVRSGASLPAGDYPLRVVLPDGATHQDSASIASGRKTVFDKTYRQGKVLVVIQPFGQGGTVKLRGRTVGKVPGAPISLWEGSHVLEVVGDGVDGSVKKKVTVVPGEETTVNVRF